MSEHITITIKPARKLEYKRRRGACYPNPGNRGTAGGKAAAIFVVEPHNAPEHRHLLDEMFRLCRSISSMQMAPLCVEACVCCRRPGQRSRRRRSRTRFRVPQR
jgi:hypothetical protein